MVDNFYTDLRKAKRAEELVREAFSYLTDKYTFEDVADQKEYYHKGDILAIEKESGRRIFIEVKDDSRIAQTHNVLCEDEVDYYGKGRKIGNMHSDYDIYCVVSQAERRIYVMDFSIIKQNYKKGIYKVIPHAQQATYCYLCSLQQIKDWGAGIDIIAY